MKRKVPGVVLIVVAGLIAVAVQARPALATVRSSKLVVAQRGASATGAAANGSHTQTQIYEAFTRSGRAAIHVTKTIRGHCWSASLAADRNDAWRCMSGNDIFDPCFSSHKARAIVLCPEAPWVKIGIRMKLTKSLPKTHAGAPSTSGLPWGIKTTGGIKCSMATGATAAVHGIRANYYCYKSAKWLWGSPSRKSQPWTIYIAPLSAKKLSARVEIALAWF